MKNKYTSDHYFSGYIIWEKIPLKSHDIIGQSNDDIMGFISFCDIHCSQDIMGFVAKKLFFSFLKC